jgi:hypothetical protein
MKHDHSFLKRNKIDSSDEVAHRLNTWQRDLLSGDDTQVRLTDFVVYRSAPEEKGQKESSYVVKIQGYQVIRISPLGSMVISAYSPLAKSLIGFGDACDYPPYAKRIVPFAVSHGAVEWNNPLKPLDPLNNNQTKRMLMAADNTYEFRVVCRYPRELSKRYVDEHICSLMGVSDAMLAMAKYIRSQIPEPNRKRLMEVYDTYGPIDTVVGDALTHLDKFRSF